MVQYNFGAPAINFAPLGQLGQTYQRGIKQRHDREIAEKREAALAGFGQNGDLAALGKTLLQAGDLEGGLQALRLSEAGQGTPWQREQAAKEAQRYADQRADTLTQREKEEQRYQETQRRLNQPVFHQDLGEDEGGLGGKRSGHVYPDGTIVYTDGTVKKAPVIGPQSSLPAPEGENTMAQLGNPVPGSTAERGFVIPGSLEGFPHGTTRAASAEGFNAPAVAGVANMPAVGSVEAQATLPAPAVAGPAVAAAPPNAVPLAPPAVDGKTAVAAPPAPAAIQRRANRNDPVEPDNAPFVRAAPPHTNVKEWVTAETKRLQAMAGGEGQTNAMKDKLAQARRVAPLLERELNSLNELVQAKGTEILPTPTKAKMQTTYGNLVMQLKTMYELGALQAKDIEQVERLLTDPTTSGYNPFEGIYKGISQEWTTAEQVKKIKQIVRDGLIEAERNLGGDPDRVPEVSRTTGTTSYTSKSGLVVEW